MEYAFAAALFFLLLIIFELLYSFFNKGESRPIDRVMERYSRGELPDEQELDILYYRKFSEIKLLNAILSASPIVRRLDSLMQQGGVNMLVGVYLLLTMTIGAVTFLLCSMVSFPSVLSALITGLAMLVPFLYLKFRRARRRSKFEALFPDALDLMGYSLKAGHSIVASFKMVEEEMASPVGEEFGRVVEELNFGMGLDASLRTFSKRIDSTELRFFATSVIIQRETGGNLVEMIEKISEVIRKKFRFREKVKALSAEGKLSAGILLALPFLTGAAILVTSPKYLTVLASDPIGPYLIGIAVTMMSIGTFIMYRLVQLDM
ncbi:type II secretion system F family protein [Desulfosediminicola ganghwensis]|uniref:type II secretion system F family protein n=1 Tax=Desulfosediminicola ganghwensis TaxID=2569540 RepID=UPI0010AC4ABD|nr:type II secretion system F family protein [Desulfosediminicola ganghwensis]